jgi:hypothetical protein
MAETAHEPTARELALRDDYANLLTQLDGDPETRGPLRSLIAKKFPKTATMMPETHVQQIVQPELEALRKERAEFQQQRLNEERAKARNALHLKFQALGVSKPEDIAELEKLMVERGSADPDSLVLWWKETKKVATPGPSRSWGMRVPGSKGSSDYFTKSPYSGVSIAEDMPTWRRERASKDFADIEAGRPLDPVA